MTQDEIIDGYKEIIHTAHGLLDALIADTNSEEVKLNLGMLKSILELNPDENLIYIRSNISNLLRKRWEDEFTNNPNN